MCYQVTCSTCGKSSWGGCGRHVKSVYNKIPEGQHCQCKGKGWPGVNPSDGTATTAAGAAEQQSSLCTIL